MLPNPPAVSSAVERFRPRLAPAAMGLSAAVFLSVLRVVRQVGASRGDYRFFLARLGLVFWYLPGCGVEK